jgi:hypothetical protein
MSSWIYSRVKNLLHKCGWSSHAIANTVVVGSQNVSAEKTFANCKLDFPVDIELYETYIKRRKEFDKKFGLLFKEGFLKKESYYTYRHYYALGVMG